MQGCKGKGWFSVREKKIPNSNAPCVPFRWRARRPSGAAQWGPPKPAIKQVWVCRIQGQWGSFENARQRSMRVPSTPHAIAKQAAAENMEATRENSRQVPHARPSWQPGSNGVPRNIVRPATGPRLPAKGPKSGLTLKLDRPRPPCVVGEPTCMLPVCPPSLYAHRLTYINPRRSTTTVPQTDDWRGG